MKRGFVRLIHNGMDVKFFDSVQDAVNAIDRYMSTAVVRYSKISDSVVKVENDFEDNCSKMRVIVFQYSTLYMEVFIIKKV